MPSEIEDAIDEAAQAPLEAEADGQRVKAHPLKDLIEADRYLDSKQAANNPQSGLRFTKLINPGAV